jgi:hypothetical protein
VPCVFEFFQRNWQQLARKQAKETDIGKPAKDVGKESNQT